MALLNLEDDLWYLNNAIIRNYKFIICYFIFTVFRLLEYESCEKLHRDIMEQLSQRALYSRSSDKYNQISVTIRLRLKQFNNEVSELYKKLDIATLSGTMYIILV